MIILIKWLSLIILGMIGGSFYWGLAAGGENGVRDVIQILKDELEVAMKYCGITDVENINPDLLSYNFS